VALLDSTVAEVELLDETDQSFSHRARRRLYSFRAAM
jgi:hypothetical protein